MEYVIGAVIGIAVFVVAVVAWRIGLDKLDDLIDEELSWTRNKVIDVENRVRSLRDSFDVLSGTQELHSNAIYSRGDNEEIQEILDDFALLRVDTDETKKNLDVALSTVEGITGIMRDILDRIDRVQEDLHEQRGWWEAHFANSKLPPLGDASLRAEIAQGGSVVHKAYDSASPTSKVLKAGTAVTITEFQEHNGLVWARIGDNEWIHGGWRSIDDRGRIDGRFGSGD